MPITGRIIQLIPVGPTSDGSPHSLYGLVDDGEVWYGTFIGGDVGKGPNEIRWRKVKSTDV